MERFHFLALAFAALLSASVVALAGATGTADANFIPFACSATLYPAVCQQSLAGYNPTGPPSYRDLAIATLKSTLSAAQSKSTYINAHSSTNNVFSVCNNTLHDTVQLAQKALSELVRMGPPGSPNYYLSLNNAQAWLSSGVQATEEQINCLSGSIFGDGQGDPGILSEVRDIVVALAQAMSNALALVRLI